MTACVAGCLMLFALSTSCTAVANYEGDGALSDRGSRSATDQYVLDLGPITDQAGFSTRGLPREEFIFGIQVIGTHPREAEAVLRQSKIHAQLTLTTNSNETVFDVAAPLQDWVWTCGVNGCSDAFAYRSGEEQGVPRRDGTVDLERTGIGPHGGWGTYFTPRCGVEYLLKVAISGDLEPLPADAIRVVATGGGWK